MSEHRKTWLLILVVVAVGTVMAMIVWNSGGGPNRGALLDRNGVARKETPRTPVWSPPLENRPPGSIVPFRRDANPMTLSVSEAIETNTHPERTTPLIGPAAFDLTKFHANPTGYLNTVEPGRVWQVAQPGPGVPQIASSSQLIQFLSPGETTVFRAQVTSGMPVTFTSFDLGAFENLLTTITVKADEKGIAQAGFTASLGTIGRVNILAASPVTSGQLTYTVYVTDKTPPRVVSSTAK